MSERTKPVADERYTYGNLVDVTEKTRTDLLSLLNTATSREDEIRKAPGNMHILLPQATVSRTVGDISCYSRSSWTEHSTLPADPVRLNAVRVFRDNSVCAEVIAPDNSGSLKEHTLRLDKEAINSAGFLMEPRTPKDTQFDQEIKQLLRLKTDGSKVLHSRDWEEIVGDGHVLNVAAANPFRRPAYEYWSDGDSAPLDTAGVRFIQSYYSNSETMAYVGFQGNHSVDALTSSCMPLDEFEFSVVKLAPPTIMHKLQAAAQRLIVCADQSSLEEVNRLLTHANKKDAQIYYELIRDRTVPSTRDLPWVLGSVASNGAVMDCMTVNDLMYAGIDRRVRMTADKVSIDEQTGQPWVVSPRKTSNGDGNIATPMVFSNQFVASHTSDTPSPIEDIVSDRF